MRVLDLFSGIGGFALAEFWVWGGDFEIISFCEIDKRCRNFLSKVWPGVPIHDDIKTLNATKWLGTVDLLVGGPPCQPASRAGKQRGKEDDCWLWPEALRVLEECQPTWCLFENPPGIEDVGLDGILDEMERLGYEVAPPFDIPACSVDSPQIRHRYWILGHSENSARRVLLQHEKQRESDFDLRGSVEGHMAHSEDERHQERRMGYRQTGRENERIAWSASAEIAESRLADTEVNERGARLCYREPEGQWRDEPANSHWDSYVWVPCADGKVRRAPDYSFSLVDGLHSSILGALGNCIVPQVAAEIMKAIKQAEEPSI